MLEKEKNDKYVITYDLGTQSLRASLVSQRGEIIKKVQIKYEKPYFSKNIGWAEQDANFYWEKIVEATKKLKAEAGEVFNKAMGVSITTIRDTIVLIDKEGRPIRPAILWLDKREASTKEPLPEKNRLLFAMAKMTDSVEMIRKISIVNWLRQEEPENWKKAHKVIMLSAYLIFKLTGKIADSKASVIGHMPYDYKNSRWQTPRDLNFCLFPIEGRKLCKLIDPGDVIGKISEIASQETGLAKGLPLVATGSDKGCETIGMGCIKEGQGAISLGTSATLQFVTDKYIGPKRFFPPYPSPYKGKYNPEFQIYRGYWLVSWFKREFAEKEVREARELGISPEEILNKRLSSIPPGCEGLILQPYFTAGVSEPQAKGSVIGLSDVHTRIHLYRAIIEGIGFALMEGKEEMEKRLGVKTRELFVAGGGSQSEEICQITADMFGLPVKRIKEPEASTIGSSAVCFLGLGVFHSMEEATEQMVHVGEVYFPDPYNHQLYEELYSKVFKKVFSRLRPLYGITKDILKRGKKGKR